MPHWVAVLYWKFNRQFVTHRDSDACISCDGLCIFAVRLNVNVKAVFSTNRISNLVNEGKACLCINSMWKSYFYLTWNGHLNSILFPGHLGVICSINTTGLNWCIHPWVFWFALKLMSELLYLSVFYASSCIDILVLMSAFFWQIILSPLNAGQITAQTEKKKNGYIGPI